MSAQDARELHHSRRERHLLQILASKANVAVAGSASEASGKRPSNNPRIATQRGPKPVIDRK